MEINKTFEFGIYAVFLDTRLHLNHISTNSCQYRYEKKQKHNDIPVNERYKGVDSVKNSGGCYHEGKRKRLGEKGQRE